MLALQESFDQVVYRHRGVMAPAITVGGTAGGLLALLAGAHPGLALLAAGGALGVGALVHTRSEFRFEAATRRVTGWRRAFRRTEHLELAFADIEGVQVEAIRGGPSAYRIVLQTPAGPVPLVPSHRSDPTVLKDARRIHAWLQAQGVAVPLHVDIPKPHTWP